VLPLVRHAQYVQVVDVPPAGIPPHLALRWWWRPRRVAIEPEIDAVVIELLRPEQPRIRLPLNEPLVLRQSGRPNRPAELLCLGDPILEDTVELVKGANRPINEPAADDNRLLRADHRPEVRSGLGSSPLQIHAIGPPIHDELVEPILHIRRFG